MSEFLNDNWKELFAIIGGVVALVKYFDTLRREQAWHRTEILFKLGDRFDSDRDIGQAVDLMYGRFKGVEISQLFDEAGAGLDNHHGVLLAHVDRLLNFLQRIAHAHLALGTLSLEEVRTFGAYFQSVILIDRLRKYCLTHGYENVVELAGKI